jgi:hypothetical protein
MWGVVVGAATESGYNSVELANSREKEL